MRASVWFSVTLALLLSGQLAADEPNWQPVLTDILKTEKTGFGGLCGVVVDHGTGCVWVNLSDRGLFCSGIGAASFKRVAEQQPRGRTKTPGCLMLDPTGKSGKMVTDLVYGSPVGVSADHGKTWTYMDRQTTHADWCAVDWTDPDLKFVLALKHEAGGLLLTSRDGGTTWAKPIALPKGLKGASGLTWLEYDPKGNTLYVMKMGSDLDKLTR